MTPEEKAWIDSASYIQLLAKWRFAPVGDRYFCGDKERSDYFIKRMSELRNADPAAAVAASKELGWEK